MRNLKYFLLISFRRQQLDKDLNSVERFFKGRVLDIGGGRKRGGFNISSKAEVLTVDLQKKFKPDIIASVEKLPFKKNSFDIVKATELFEHVKNPEKGISECARVLKKKGLFILSMPFLYPVHADPFDYQRWTREKLKIVLEENNLKIKKLKVQGYYFTVLADFIKAPVLGLPLLLRYFLYLFILPLCLFFMFLDKNIARKSNLLNKYHQGYFIICQRI